MSQPDSTKNVTICSWFPHTALCRAVMPSEFAWLGSSTWLRYYLSFITSKRGTNGSCKENDTPWHFTVRTLSKSKRFRTRNLQNASRGYVIILKFSRSKAIGCFLVLKRLDFDKVLTVKCQGVSFSLHDPHKHIERILHGNKEMWVLSWHYSCHEKIKYLSPSFLIMFLLYALCSDEGLTLETSANILFTAFSISTSTVRTRLNLWLTHLSISFAKYGLVRIVPKLTSYSTNTEATKKRKTIMPSS